MKTVKAIRPQAEVMTLQKLPYFAGISGQTAASESLSMHIVVIPWSWPSTRTRGSASTAPP